MVVDGIQRPLLPFTDHAQNLVGEAADGAVQNADAVDVLNMGLDIAGGHALGVHGQNLLLNVLANAGLILFQHLGLKLTLSVSGNRHLHIPKADAQRFAIVAVAAVGCVFVFVVAFAVAQFLFQLCLQTIFFEWIVSTDIDKIIFCLTKERTAEPMLPPWERSRRSTCWKSGSS